MNSADSTGTIDRIYRIIHEGAPRHVIERNGTWRLLEGDLFGRFEPGVEVSSTGLTLLSPVEPSKIIAVGLNYRDHAAEQHKQLPAEPMIFFKPPTAVIGPNQPITIPPDVGRVDHEAEVAVIIGRRAHRVTSARAHEYILGTTCINDVTARDLQNREIQFTRCKGFDTFGPLGPCIAVGLDNNAIDVEAWVNGECRQSSNTSELIFDIPYLVEFISAVMTLLPGDVISTGTPAGVAPIKDTDYVTIKVEGVGELTNPVAKA